MFALAFLAAFALTTEPMAIANRRDVHPRQQAIGLLEPYTDATAAKSTLDTTATVGSRIAGQTRGQPRVSKTRCAFVGCEPQCNIKGTRNAQGDLVYRTPGSPEYAQANVERMFCSRADAQEAGYREERQG